MSPRKLKNSMFWVYAALSVAVSVGMLVFLYYLFRVVLGSALVPTIVIVGAAGILVIWATTKGLYGAFRIQFRGESMDTFMEREANLMPKSPKFWFWFLSPLLVPAFAYIYTLPVSFLVWLGLLPFGEAASRHIDRVVPFARGLSFALSLATILWLWRMVKKNFLQKERDKSVVAEQKETRG
jgi:hypothetical protein